MKPTPTPDEIAERCAAERAKWSRKRRKKRAACDNSVKAADSRVLKHPRGITLRFGNGGGE